MAEDYAVDAESGSFSSLGPTVEVPATDPEGMLPGDADLKVALSPTEEAELARFLNEVIDEYWIAMSRRMTVWRQIDDAYNELPDSTRSGRRPGASQIVSATTRSLVNLTTAYLVDAITSVTPMLDIEVIMGQERTAEKEQEVAEAKRLAAYLDAYMRHKVDMPAWLPLWIQGVAKKGTKFIRPYWEEVEDYRAERKGDERRKYGCIRVDQYRPEDIIIWPLTVNDPQRAMIVGHRFELQTRGEFLDFCRGMGMSTEETERWDVPPQADPSSPGALAAQNDLRGKDINISSRPYSLQPYEVFEFFLNMHPPGLEGRGKQRLQIFLLRSGGPRLGLLYVGKNANDSGRHHYIPAHYVQEEDCFWGSGVGHEQRYPQAMGDALYNLLLDNLKVVGSHLITYRMNTVTETMVDQISPGMRVPIEEAGDLATIPLGGDMTQIVGALQLVEQEKQRNANFNATTQGFADPVLKSGSSPGIVSQMMEGPGKKFKLVDANVQRALSELYMTVLELLQQYEPEGALVEYPEDQVLLRIKLDLGQKDLRRKYRIVPRAPSATANKQELKSNLMLLLNLSSQFATQILQLAGQVYAQNPVRLQELSEGLLKHLVKIYDALVELMEVPGLSASSPQIGPPTPTDQLVMQLVQSIQQLGQQNQQLQAQLQALQPPPQGGPPMMPQQGGMPDVTAGAGGPMGPAGQFA